MIQDLVSRAGERTYEGLGVEDLHGAGLAAAGVGEVRVLTVRKITQTVGVV